MAVSELVITPVTWPQHKHSLSQTKTGLLNLVGWYGSTHALAMWRKEPQFLAKFEAQQIAGFDPQLMNSKHEADVLLLPIMAEASSKAAATEIGMLLLNALASGQTIKVYLEPINPVDFMRHQLAKLALPATPTEKAMRLALHEAGVGDAILAIAIHSEIDSTFQIFKALMQGQELPLNEIKDSLLGQTAAFQNADNVRRVRTLVGAHLQRLATDTRFANFFTYKTGIIFGGI